MKKIHKEFFNRCEKLTKEDKGPRERVVMWVPWALISTFVWKLICPSGTLTFYTGQKPERTCNWLPREK